jgi:hypothetical protein
MGIIHSSKMLYFYDLDSMMILTIMSLSIFLILPFLRQWHLNLQRLAALDRLEFSEQIYQQVSSQYAMSMLEITIYLVGTLLCLLIFGRAISSSLLSYVFHHPVMAWQELTISFALWLLMVTLLLSIMSHEYQTLRR